MVDQRLACQPCFALTHQVTDSFLNVVLGAEGSGDINLVHGELSTARWSSGRPARLGRARLGLGLQHTGLPPQRASIQ